jgi:protein-tyrosine-phosphatase
MSEPLRVLFVCTANICRSPVMELTARAMAGASRDVEFTSAGTLGFDAQPINPDMAVTLTTGLGDAFRSRRLTRAILDEADLVLTAESSHRAHILEEHPQLHRRVFTLGQFAATIGQIPDLTGRELVAEAGVRRAAPRPADDVADPYRRGRAAAEKATGTITDMLSVIVPRLTGSSADNATSAPDLEG